MSNVVPSSSETSELSLASFQELYGHLKSLFDEIFDGYLFSRNSEEQDAIAQYRQTCKEQYLPLATTSEEREYYVQQLRWSRRTSIAMAKATQQIELKALNVIKGIAVEAAKYAKGDNLSSQSKMGFLNITKKFNELKAYIQDQMPWRSGEPEWTYETY